MGRKTGGNRLTRPEEFEQVFENGAKVHSQYFVAFVVPGAGLDSRLGLAISRKSAGHAVRRNLIKRQARQTFRLLEVLKGHPLDVVLVAKSGGRSAERQALYEDVKKLWRKVESTGSPQP